jgi:protein-disulfide reductase (glutathione)
MPRRDRFPFRYVNVPVAAWSLALLWGFVALVQPLSARQPNMAELWNGAEIAWREVGPGIREAGRTGKPVVMLFHASWCSSCKRYRAVWKDPGVVAASKSFVMILVDVDKEPEANGAFSPDGTYVPRTIFYTAEGDVMKDVVGKDREYPHTIDLDDPTELRTLMLKAAGGGSPPSATDRRAEN